MPLFSYFASQLLFSVASLLAMSLFQLQVPLSLCGRLVQVSWSVAAVPVRQQASSGAEEIYSKENQRTVSGGLSGC
jgi:hypothetical protein